MLRKQKKCKYWEFSLGKNDFVNIWILKTEVN